MTLLEAIWLGLIQGVTEFLPVSSSAHLVFFQHLFGLREPLILFDVVLHLGTLLSLVIYFAADLAGLVRDSVYGIFYLFQRKPKEVICELAPGAPWALGLFIASVPTALIGYFFKEWFESLFGSLTAVGLALLVTSALLWSTRYFSKMEKEIERIKVLDFLIIGIFQGIAIAPGISRSGSTLVAGLFRGLKKDDAFRFAFLLAIPAILGAGLLELRQAGLQNQVPLSALVAGFLMASSSGFLALSVLARVVRNGRIHQFAYYTLPFGALVLIVARWIG